MHALTKGMMASLSLIAGQARAETICNGCEWVETYPGTYIGAYWPGDRGTFGHHDMAAQYGPLAQFDNHWILDLNDTGEVSLTITALPGQALDGPYWAVEVYPDAGSICQTDTLPGRCTSFAFVWGTHLISKETTTRRWSARLGVLPAGRYLIRLSGGTRVSGESSYEARISVGR